MKCKICKDTANIYLKYCGLKLCKIHFIEYLQKRVKRSIKRYNMVRKNDIIAVALSGGKDSQALVHILRNLYPEPVSLIGLHIDLGIDSYSQESLKHVKNICKELEVPLHIISIKEEFNFTIDEITKNRRIKRPICANCGLIKRYVLNFFARKLNTDILATGHVLDDEVTVLLSNLVNNNMTQLKRGGPYLPSTDPTIIARIKPLYEISEYETSLYVYYNNISCVEIQCPYDVNATISSFKEVTNKMEEIQPGSRYSLLRSYIKNYRNAFQNYKAEEVQELTHCSICGGPTTRDICAFCSLRKRLGVLTND
ncbi:MAG: TIGR00269 family protein [Candidatus Helarchaeota archaeon]